MHSLSFSLDEILTLFFHYRGFLYNHFGFCLNAFYFAPIWCLRIDYYLLFLLSSYFWSLFQWQSNFMKTFFSWPVCLFCLIKQYACRYHPLKQYACRYHPLMNRYVFIILISAYCSWWWLILNIARLDIYNLTFQFYIRWFKTAPTWWLMCISINHRTTGVSKLT